jgi:hypothetical protein
MNTGGSDAGASLASLIAAQQESNDTVRERVLGVLAGDPLMPDGTPINSRTIGRLMSEHRDVLEAWLDTQGDDE